MKYLTSAFIIFLIISCKRGPEYTPFISHFNLKEHYDNIPQKLTKIDTVKITTDLSVCAWERYEQITLTKENDSLKVVLKVFEMRTDSITEVFKFHKADTTWNVKEFITSNKHLNTGRYPTVIFSSKNDTLKYYTSGLSDKNRFIKRYFEWMFKLNPKNKLYNNVRGIE